MFSDIETDHSTTRESGGVAHDPVVPSSSTDPLRTYQIKINEETGNVDSWEIVNPSTPHTPQVHT